VSCVLFFILFCFTFQTFNTSQVIVVFVVFGLKKIVLALKKKSERHKKIVVTDTHDRR